MTDKIIAFEIKSDFDNLDRLNKQTNEYAKYFDKVVVVATSKHIDKILKTTPPEISVWEVEANRKIVVLRDGAANLTRSPTDLLCLLTKADSRRFLKSAVEGQAVEIGQISAALARAFEDRHAAPSRRFWDVIGHRSAEAADIELLSRFADLRTKAAEHAERSATFWAVWHAAADKLVPPSYTAN